MPRRSLASLSYAQQPRTRCRQNICQHGRKCGKDLLKFFTDSRPSRSRKVAIRILSEDSPHIPRGTRQSPFIAKLWEMKVHNLSKCIWHFEVGWVLRCLTCLCLAGPCSGLLCRRCLDHWQQTLGSIDGPGAARMQLAVRTSKRSLWRALPKTSSTTLFLGTRRKALSKQPF